MNPNNISIIGIGRLGLCAALVFEKAKFNVVGVDVSADYVNAINNKTFKSSEPQVERYLSESQNLKGTLSFDEALTHSDTIFIFVATPTGTTQSEMYDHSVLSKVLMDMNERKIENKIISIGCTVAPGYISNVAKYLIKDCKDCTLCYNPEFIAQGNIIDGFLNPDLVLIGSSDKQVAETIKKIYQKCCENEPKFCLVDIESATIAKLSINCFITTKIAFGNMVGDIVNATPNANVDEVLRTIGYDSRIGEKCLNYGFGFGGMCFPRDNRCLGYYAKSKGIPPSIPEATDDSNNFHANYQIQNIKNKLLEQNLKKIIFTDVKYKPDCPVPIIEESQALCVANGLVDEGFNVIIQESKEVVKEVIKKYGGRFSYIVGEE